MIYWEYSKVGADVVKLNVEEFNLLDALDEIKISFDERVSKMGKFLNIDINIEHDRVLGDQFKLIQILNKLISNSLKYSNKGAEINVSAKEFEIG